jgi:hypothetical protein
MLDFRAPSRPATEGILVSEPRGDLDLRAPSRQATSIFAL